MTSTSLVPFTLFGHTSPWFPQPWTTTDDRLRGGASQSYLSPLPNNSARFYGHLDTSTLGGAGFASQFSPIPEKGPWNLSAYDGLEIELGKGDGKVYTLILKDGSQVEKRDDGREKAGVSWEVEFKAGGDRSEDGDDGIRRGRDGAKVWVPWGDLKPTYRGKEIDDAGQLKTREVKKIGLMMRRCVSPS